MKEIIIPKEKAVFWLDGNGCWNNVHGKFELKKIIDHFNSSIEKDENGYHVAQINGDVLEKVYFRYEDTAVFAVDIKKTEKSDNLILVLNTGKKMALNPEKLSIKNDGMFMRIDDELIKFTDRSMLKLMKMIEHENGLYFFKYKGKKYEIVNCDEE
ncbi:MFS transporter permease [Desulfobacterales bacterium HSG16]|nr:MFS transporter permease [Desulfobacterales bacterium HSG16]